LALATRDPLFVVSIHPRQQHAIASSNLVESLPQKQRDTDHVDKTEDGVVVRAAELEALARP